MKQSDKNFLGDMMVETNRRLYSKNKRGIKEHGGQLWTKKGLLTNAEDETLDQISYHFALRFQISKALEILQPYKDIKIGVVKSILEGILGEPND